MTSAITAASAATQIPANASAPPKSAAHEKAAGAGAVAQPSAGSANTSKTQQQAALNQLLAKYTRDQAQDSDSQVLSALGKQITAAAKALGQHVTLPHAPPGSDAGSAAPSASGTLKANMVNVTA